MNFGIIVSTICATVTFAPPILPFTELSDKKIETTLQHMLVANECTPMDMSVIMQLDHIRWKYNQMRETFYASARDADDDDVVRVKHLGKMFDKMDATIEEECEKALQRTQKEIENKENTPGTKPLGREI